VLEPAAPAAPVPMRPRASAPVPVGAVARLQAATTKAHKRGAWAFAIVLVAGLVAACTGWALGAAGAPAARSASLTGFTTTAGRVPAVRGLSTPEALRALHAAALSTGPVLHRASGGPEGSALAVLDASGHTLRAGATPAPGVRVRLVVAGGE
jgi:hypothetical protein